MVLLFRSRRKQSNAPVGSSPRSPRALSDTKHAFSTPFCLGGNKFQRNACTPPRPSVPACVVHDPSTEKGEGTCEERQAPQAGVQGAATKAEQACSLLSLSLPTCCHCTSVLRLLYIGWLQVLLLLVFHVFENGVFVFALACLESVSVVSLSCRRRSELFGLFCSLLLLFSVSKVVCFK